MSAAMRAELASELHDCADDLGRVIDATKARIEADRGKPWGVDCTPYEALDTNGRPVLGDLLAARANVLVALARL